MAYIITDKEWKTVLHYATFKREDYGKINTITDNLYSRTVTYPPEEREKLMQGIEVYQDNPDFLEIV